jgi:hypothetical protein
MSDEVNTKQRVTKNLNIHNGRSGGTDEAVISRIMQISESAA